MIALGLLEAEYEESATDNRSWCENELIPMDQLAQLAPTLDDAVRNTTGGQPLSDHLDDALLQEEELLARLVLDQLPSEEKAAVAAAIMNIKNA